MVDQIEAIKKAIEAGELTQAALAEASGISPTTLNAIIQHAKPNPRIRTAQKLVDSFEAWKAEHATQPAEQAEPAEKAVA